MDIIVDNNAATVPPAVYNSKALIPNQVLTFPSNDENNSVAIIAQNVIVNSTAGNHDHGSSKVKLKNIVDYNWENRLYTGQLLAVHMDGNFLAYGIKAPSASSASKWNSMVRVVHRSSEKRALVKLMRGQVQDLAFAYISAEVILACIDEEDNIFIHNIELRADGISWSLLLHVVGTAGIGSEHRVVWCPFIPDDDNDGDDPAESDGAKLLVTTHGNKACMWNIGMIIAKYRTGSHTFDPKPCLLIEEHTDVIVDAAFSPDGTALATASRDGYVMFFQIYVHSDTPRCLHKWSPHGGKPLSCLFFLDNHNSFDTEWFWKFAVTGTENNSVLKVWSCKSWVCLQTITFTPNPEFPIFGLKADLDKSARYLMLSDVYRKVLFILQLEINSDDTEVYCRSISEFFLSYPILSFGILDAGMKTFKCPSSCSDPYHRSNACESPETPVDEEENNEKDELMEERKISARNILIRVIYSLGTIILSILRRQLLQSMLEDWWRPAKKKLVAGASVDNGDLSGCDAGEAGVEGCNVRAVVHLYLVQPKSLQEGHITFTPPPNSLLRRGPTLKEVNEDSLIPLPDISQDLSTSNLGLAEIPKHDVEEEVNSNNVNVQQPLSAILAHQSQQLKNLLIQAQAAPQGGLIVKQPPSPQPLGQIPLLQPLAPVAPSVPPPPFNLMTPDAFSSPAKRDDEDPPIANSPDIMRLPPAPILTNELQLLNKSLPIDSPIVINSEANNSATNTARAFPTNPPPPTAFEGKFASGGSSPSREVQEILSLKGSDCFYEDDLEDLNSQSPRIEPQSPVANNVQEKSDQNLLEGFKMYSAPEKELYISPRMDHIVQHNNTSKHSCGLVESSQTVWPDINMAKINEANQRKAQTDKSSAQTNNTQGTTAAADVSPTDEEEDLMFANDYKESMDDGDNNGLSHKNKKSLRTCRFQLKKMLDLLGEQQKEIAMLHSEIIAMRQDQNNTAVGRAEEANSTVRLVEQALQKNQIQVKQMIDAAITSKVETDRTNREALLSGVSQVMGAQMAERLGAAVAHEVRTTLLPRFDQILEPAVQKLNFELATKLTAADHLLTENIGKLVNSKNVLDSLSTAVSATLSKSTKVAFKEAVQTSLVPNMEKAQMQMFKQITQTFSSGMMEYLSAFETSTKRAVERASVIDEACAQINTVGSQLQHVLDQQNKQYILNSQTQESLKQLNASTKELKSAMSKTLQGAFENQMTPIKECIKEQISTGMAAHVSQLEDSVLLAVRSRAQTPAPAVVDMQSQQNHIEQLLNNGQINTAFQQALSASDLRLVVHACAMADPRKVFCHPCPLQQHVLLSLIQQLGADMASDTQLKHRFLEEAVMNLDNSYPVTREHMPVVLKALKKQLTTFIETNPGNEFNRKLKVLILAMDGLNRPGGSTDNFNV